MTVKGAALTFGGLVVVFTIMAVVGLAYALRPRDDEELI